MLVVNFASILRIHHLHKNEAFLNHIASWIEIQAYVHSGILGILCLRENQFLPHFRIFFRNLGVAAAAQYNVPSTQLTIHLQLFYHVGKNFPALVCNLESLPVRRHLSCYPFSSHAASLWAPNRYQTLPVM